MIRLVPLLLLAACRRDPSREPVDFGAAFEACDPDAIRFLAGKHNFAPAFEPCGSNNFRSATWSPDGRFLLFELPTGAFVLDAASLDKHTTAVPVEDPLGPGAWTSPTRFALPIGPAEGETAPRLVLYDVGTAALTWLPLPGLSDPMDLTAGEGPQLLLSAVTDRRRIVAVDVDDGTMSDPFPWTADLPVERFSYQPAQDAVLISAAGTTRLYDMVGTPLGAWSPATRGLLHPGGRWVALEHDGEAVPLFGQHTWDDQSESARTRERSREEIERDLPEWAPKSTNPPSVALVDRATGQRWEFTGFHGTDFQWYEARDYYASLVLWGFEGIETNRNVVLGDLADRMAYAERGQELMGVEKFRAEAP